MGFIKHSAGKITNVIDGKKVKEAQQKKENYGEEEKGDKEK